MSMRHKPKDPVRAARRRGNAEARRLYPDPLGPCERCQHREAIHRHHKDNDTSNNHRSNLEFLCRECHRLSEIPTITQEHTVVLFDPRSEKP
jgi:5-methylcytosine-specific restriction endonuclease McrA